MNSLFSYNAQINFNNSNLLFGQKNNNYLEVFGIENNNYNNNSYKGKNEDSLFRNISDNNPKDRNFIPWKKIN